MKGLRALIARMRVLYEKRQDNLTLARWVARAGAHVIESDDLYAEGRKLLHEITGDEDF